MRILYNYNFQTFSKYPCPVNSYAPRPPKIHLQRDKKCTHTHTANQQKTWAFQWHLSFQWSVPFIVHKIFSLTQVVVENCGLHFVKARATNLYDSFCVCCHISYSHFQYLNMSFAVIITVFCVIPPSSQNNQIHKRNNTHVHEQQFPKAITDSDYNL